jgi:TetR/AcrR family transcriptional repressor of uid operon
MPRHVSASADRVLDAALACIGRVGVAKTTLDDVAREAGCARATVYRYFPGKQQLVAAVVTREATDLGDHLVAMAADAQHLSDAVVTVITEGTRLLAGHDALTFVATYEPELLLRYLAFEREDAVLRAASQLVAPAFTRFLTPERAERLGEWIARIALSHLCNPSEAVDVADARQVRKLVEDFVLPGLASQQPSEIDVTLETDFAEGVTR